MASFRLGVSRIALSVALTFGAVAPISLAQAQALNGLPDLTSVVERVEPSVVSIRITKLSARQTDSDIYSGLRSHFGSGSTAAPTLTAWGDKRPAEDKIDYKGGAGSGFFVSQDGHIITNAHVIKGAVDIIVKTSDKRELYARAVGADERSDVALIKVDAKSTPLPMGEFSSLKKGQWVLAIGSPFELDFSLSVGVVSNPIRYINVYKPYIQSNIAINPGNSGSPLMNIKGEVIGINSNMVSNSLSSAGVSLAIPIADALKVANQLKTTGRVTRGHLGAKMGEVTPGMAAAIGIEGPVRGAMIARIEDGSPAEKSGLRPGDVILKVNGQAMENWSQIASAVGDSAPGSNVALDVWRKGKIERV